MAELPRPPASATREALIAACLVLLREGGPDAASQRAICARAGVGAPTLYHHFGDLSALHRMAGEQAQAAILQAKRAAAPDEAVARLAVGWDAYLAFAREEPGLFAALARQLVDGKLSASATKSYVALLADVRAVAVGGRLMVEPEAAAQALWAAAHGAACLALAGRGEGDGGFAVSPGLGATLKQATFRALFGDQPAS